MKLVSFRIDAVDRWGIADGDRIADLTTPECKTIRDALTRLSAGGLRELAARARRYIPLEQVELLPPIPNPDKILCVGVNYRAHASEVEREPARHPALFVRFASSLVGHLTPVVQPFQSDAFDYEGELAVIIGRSARHVRASDALAYVAGYSCFAENSVRDFQAHSRQVTAGKNFCRSGAFGPWLVTADEITEPAKLELSTRLNGELVQHDFTANMIFSVPSLIAYVSSFCELVPGDVIATGTPSGVGVARSPQRFLQAGDVLEVEVSRVGTLRNRVIREARPVTPQA